MTLLLLTLLAAAPDGGAPSGAPLELIDDAKLVFRVADCADDSALPDNFDKKTVDDHCKKQHEWVDRYNKQWGTKAKDFLAKLEPAGLPTEIVCPFCGGDMLSVLNTYPFATSVTTMSLEHAGDPRKLKTVKDAKTLKDALHNFEETEMSTLLSNDSKSVNMSKLQVGLLPGQLSMHLMGLMTHGFEPVSVRYFRIEPDGALHYFTAEEVEQLDKEQLKHLRGSWKDPDFSPAFSNVEVTFRPKGQPNAPTRTFRHIAADLLDEPPNGLKTNPGLMKYLEGRGKVTVLVKAASYLLWRNDANLIRDYLLGHSDYMLSDSTGVPPYYAKKAGFVQEPYGSFEVSFLGATKQHNEDFKKLFEKAKPLPFRFGYPDGSPEKRSHMVVTRRAEADAGK
jgi:hypothetical protein